MTQKQRPDHLYDGMHRYWQNAIKNEPVIPAGLQHPGLDMNKDFIPTPWQSFDMAIMALGSYPTKSTMSIHFWST